MFQDSSWLVWVGIALALGAIEAATADFIFLMAAITLAAFVVVWPAGRRRRTTRCTTFPASPWPNRQASTWQP